MNRKSQLIEVFEDTQKFYTQDPALAAAVKTSRDATALYEADDYPELPPLQKAGAGSGKVTVTKSKTFEAAMRLHQAYPDQKIGVLNFASAARPGGGVKNGSSAQEESLCRCSTLFPTLDRRWLWQKHYDVNRAAKDVVHSDACIYSPGIIICKTDESVPKRMAPKDWVTVDVISCAAPNLRNEPANWHNPDTGDPVKMDPEKLLAIHKKRAQHLLTVAAANQVNILVLGAFGCGAFANDPAVVARAYKEVLPAFRDRFDLIEFAVYCREYDTANYTAFSEILAGS